MTGSIFHVVENLDKGAVENWLVSVFLESREKYPELKWTFYCMLGKEGRLDEKVRAAGGTIIYSPFWISEKLKFFRHLRKTLKEGHYDILHMHHDYLAGFHLLSAVGLKFKQKIVHVHNTDKWLPIGNAFARRKLLIPAKYLVLKYSDRIVGISNDTLQEFVGNHNQQKPKAEILYYGIDLAKFHSPALDLSATFGIPKDAKVLLFTGRMNELKNPAFVVDILNELLKHRSDAYALFVGKGGEEESVKQKATQYNLTDRIILAGWRNDIAEIMKASDVFVFPRVEYPREGLGLVVVEAQSAGLPMVLSNGIVPDAIVIDELTHFIPLRDNPAEWAATIHAILEKGKPMTTDSARQKMEASRFSLPNATDNLIKLYQ